MANPCNTNANILYEKIKALGLKINKENITCLTRLDQNRAEGIYKEQSGKKANFFIWGNHSTSCVPDTFEDIAITEEFVKKVQQRGAEILNVKGTSSSFSAAKAIADHLRDWYLGSDKAVSMGVVSNGEYGVEKELVCSFPVKCRGEWKYEIVSDVNLKEEKKKMIANSVNELIEEAKEIKDI